MVADVVATDVGLAESADVGGPSFTADLPEAPALPAGDTAGSIVVADVVSTDVGF